MKKFHNGERVIVPWGLDEVEGTVVDTFGPPNNRLVSVRIELTEGGEPSDIGFRADDIRSIAGSTSG